MLYRGLLPARGMAQVLKMPLERMGEVLEKGAGALGKGAAGRRAAMRRAGGGALKTGGGGAADAVPPGRTARQRRRPRIAKAVRAAEKEAGLKEELARQRKLDAENLAALEQVTLAAALLARIAAADPAEPSLSPAKHALQAAGGAGDPHRRAGHAVLGRVCAVEPGAFVPGQGRRDPDGGCERRNDRYGDGAEIRQGGALDDWFFSNTGLRIFMCRPGFRRLRGGAGARLFKQDGMPVAQVAVEDHHMVFYSFKADDFGVSVQPNDTWRIFEDGDWVAAVQAARGGMLHGGIPGDEREMEEFLAEEEVTGGGEEGRFEWIKRGWKGVGGGISGGEDARMASTLL